MPRQAWTCGMCRQTASMATQTWSWHQHPIMGQEGIVTEKIEYGVRSTGETRRKKGRSPVKCFSVFYGRVANPEGIEHDRPGLTRSGYPGITVACKYFNPERVAECGVGFPKPRWGFLFFRHIEPRVAAARQPWAILLQSLRALRGVVSPYGLFEA
jgi:hypothetical protein